MDIFQLKATLAGSHPPIWRRVLVPGAMSLGDLHYVLQGAFGWENSHLHQFIIGNEYYGTQDDAGGGPGYHTNDEGAFTVAQMLGPKSKFSYEYDFGDSWEHQIIVEKISPVRPSEAYPRCIAGKRACPPEDCGGIYGYLRLLEILSDPSHEEHEEMLEWTGDVIDPEAFSVEEADEALEYLRPYHGPKGVPLTLDAESFASFERNSKA